MFKFGLEALQVLYNVQNLAYKHFNAILECGKFIHVQDIKNIKHALCCFDCTNDTMGIYEKNKNEYVIGGLVRSFNAGRPTRTGH